MNQGDTPRPGVVTIEWEYVPGSLVDFQAARPVWLDIDGVCGSWTNVSAVAVPDRDVFDIAMQPAWAASFAGDVVHVTNHLHDGGARLEVLKNGHVVCNGVAGYGEAPGYVGTMMMPDGGDMDMGGAAMGDMSMDYISSLSSCASLGKTAVGDKWSVRAYYNRTVHPGMTEAGKPAPIMGIAIMFWTTK